MVHTEAHYKTILLRIEERTYDQMKAITYN